MIQAGDQVVCVGGQFSTCQLHNERVLGPDPHPEMVGRVFLVKERANWAAPVTCSGLIALKGDPRFWCVGCFRKIEKADESFLEELFARLRKEKEVA